MRETDSAALRMPAHPVAPQPDLSNDIERELADLGRSLADMHVRYPFDADFWTSFKSCAQDIGRRARNDSELRRVQMRLVLMLSQDPAAASSPPAPEAGVFAPC